MGILNSVADTGNNILKCLKSATLIAKSNFHPILGITMILKHL
jgi:hypothetical protein